MAKSPTRTPQTPRSTESGSSDSTKPTSTTSNELSPMKLEEEARQFRARKKPPTPPKPMTSKIYLMGMAMNALIARSHGLVRKEDIKREAEEWAEYMLGED